jgi:aminoglycoside phosphotransferase (APT) family kinase protein
VEPYWEHTDCDLDAGVVDRLLGEQAAHLAFGPARYIDEGWSSWAYTASDGVDDWILRFPKRAFVARELEREMSALPCIAAAVHLPVPRFALEGRPSDLFPHRFTGYRKLPGSLAIDGLDERIDCAAVGQSLGRFLAALHEVRGVPLVSPGPSDMEREEATTQLAEFGSSISADAREFALAVIELPAPPPREVVLCHNDLFPEHILVEGGLPAGVIDWGEVGGGDPASDLAGLYVWRGNELLEPALRVYAGQRSLAAGYVDELRARVRRIAVYRAAADLEYGTRANRADYLWMARRFLEQVLD